MDAGARSLYNTKKPIQTIADLKGLKIRVIGNPMFVDMMNALGGNGVAMGYDQVFSALQTGVDRRRREQSAELRVRQSLHRRQILHADRAPDRAGNAGVLDARPGTRCRKDDQALIKKFAREAQLEERELWNKYETAGAGKGQGRRHARSSTIADKKPFQDAVKPVWDKYGPKYPDMIKRIQAVA